MKLVRVGFTGCVRAKVRSISRTDEALSVDKTTVDSFIADFTKLIEDGQYSKDQIFNVDELGLFWKKRATKTYTTSKQSKLSGPKQDKKRITLKLGSF